MPRIYLLRISILLLMMFTFQVKSQFYMGSQQEFGKNRVRYREFFWTYYNYDRYQVYFYELGKEIGSYVSKSVDKNLRDIEKLLDYQFEGKLQFVIYNTQNDFSQSNIGMSADDQSNTGGTIKIVGTRVILYFEGDHKKLDQQIRAGIAEILINQMMYGGSVKDAVRNSTLLTLPEWYIKGIISYISMGWNPDIDSRVRDIIKNPKFKKLNHLEGQQAMYAGHSIWRYIAETYGEGVISNVLYMTKVSRSIETAMLYVIGNNLRDLTLDWRDTFETLYKDLDTTVKLPATPALLKKPKITRVYTQLKISPDGKKLIYATNEMGQYKVWLYDVATQKTKRLIKRGFKLDRINDYSFPLLTWHPSGQFFAMITEEKSDVMLSIYNLETQEITKREIYNFQKILDFTYSSDGKKFAISGVQNGSSNIALLNASSNAFEPITNDIYDDINPRFINGGKEVIFSSNRTNDTIKFVGNDPNAISPNYDLFVYNLDSKSKVLKRVTNTPAINETQGNDFEGIYFSYLSEANGINNRYIAYFDSVIAYVDTSAHYRYVVKSMPLTNYPRNILEQDISLSCNKYAEIIYSDGRYRMFVGDLKPLASFSPYDLKLTSYRTSQIRKAAQEVQKREADRKQKIKQDSLAKAKEQLLLNKMKENQQTLKVDSINKLTPAPKKHKPKVLYISDSTSSKQQVDINNYSFDSPEKKTTKDSVKKEVLPVIVPITKDTSQNKPPGEFVLAKQQNYYISFSIDKVVSQLNNSFLNAGYQKFTGGNGPVLLNPGLNELVKVGISDLFEDYRIVGATVIPFNFNNTEYLLSYEDRLKNLDKQLVLHRIAFNKIGQGIGLSKVVSQTARFTLKHPFNEVLSLRGTLTYRNDRSVTLATEYNNLVSKDVYGNWGGLTMQLVFDNTISKGVNLYNGSRAKFFVEYFRQAENNKSNFAVIGLDARHYQKIFRDLIWAGRVAASTSFGDQKLIYYMGGVDNWIRPKFDNEINISGNNYAFQTLATPMRGFYQNIRNGNNFALINNEIRLPIFRFLFNRPIRSDFIYNFQVVGFSDIGTAWNGWNPYSEENSLNRIIKASPGSPLTISLNSHKEPIVAGYGLGLRSRIFGYFVRVDFAWGVEDKQIFRRIRYLSLTTDF